MKKADQNFIKCLCTDIGIKSKIHEVHRLGICKTPGNRLIKVVFQTAKDKDDLMNNLKNLKARADLDIKIYVWREFKVS